MKNEMIRTEVATLSLSRGLKIIAKQSNEE